MKSKYIISSLFLLITCFLSAQSNFSKGFSVGYKKGYCQDQGLSCIEPTPPIAPLPNVFESSDSYTDGYNRGMVTGLKAKKTGGKVTSSRYQSTKPTFVEDILYDPYKGINNAVAIGNALRKSKGRAIEHLKNENYQAVADICFAGLRIQPSDDEFM